MSVLVNLYSNVSHAYTVFNFSIQDSVLSYLLASVLTYTFQGMVGY